MSKKDTGIMNSQTQGALSSDQKIENVFHAFGYSVPVGKDGRRMWPTKFKREMARQMNSGKLTIGDVRKSCQVSDKTVYKWRQEFGKGDNKKSPSNKSTEQAFSEIKVMDDPTKSLTATDQITLKRGGVELQCPFNYPVHQLAQLIRSIDGKP
ncbi:MAG: transposase [Hyphomicrobiales bacterium]